MQTYFFLCGSTLLLLAALAVIRDRRASLRPFGIAASLTVLALLAGAVLRLFDPAASGNELRRLLDVITVGNLSAASILLIAWTVKLRQRV